MTAWILDTFGGLAPRYDDRQLPEQGASVATDLSPTIPALAPLRGTTLVGTAGTNDNSLFYYNNAWIYSNNQRDYVRTFQHNDADDKLYYSDYPNRPKVRSSSSVYNLGQPTPAALTFGAINTGDVTDISLNETWIYTYTYVDSFGFESAAAIPASAGEVGVGATVALDFPSLATGPGINIDKVYVYRSNVGSNEADFQFLVSLDAVTAAGSGYTDAILSSALQETLEAYTNIPPPSENDADGALRSLIPLSGNILVGHTKRSVHLSKPNQPHAWPEANKYPVPEEIVGIIDVQSGVLVLTGSAVYVLFGSAPEAMQLERIPSEQNCLSAKSIVRVDNTVMWAATDGLAVYDNGRVQIMTQDILTRAQWLADYNPSSIHAFAHEGAYIAFGTQPFVFNLQNQQRQLTHVTLAGTLKDMHRLEDNDQTYLLLDNGFGTQTIESWDTGTPKPYTWASKLKQFHRATALSYLRLYSSEDDNVGLLIEADDHVLFDGLVATNSLVRLPITTKARAWRVSFTGTVRVEVFTLADALGELP